MPCPADVGTRQFISGSCLCYIPAYDEKTYLDNCGGISPWVVGPVGSAYGETVPQQHVIGEVCVPHNQDAKREKGEMGV